MLAARLARHRKMNPMLVLRATKKLRDKIGGPPLDDGDRSTTVLGDWYAHLLPWRPQVAILVNAATLLPILTPLSPAAGLPGRVADVIAAALTAHGVSDDVVAAEREQMRAVRVAPTADRSVVGSMNEFVFLADRQREHRPDLRDLSMWLAQVPCSPLYKRHVHPDAELAALIAAL